MKAYTDTELAECPKINVAGKEWPVPIFGPRQNRRIVPCIIAIGSSKIEEMDTDKIDKLYDMVYWALNRAHPDIKQNDFVDWEIPLDEAFKCIPVIAKQTGIMSFKETTKGEAPATGEGLTGTSSSPELLPALVGGGMR